MNKLSPDQVLSALFATHTDAELGIKKGTREEILARLVAKKNTPKVRKSAQTEETEAKPAEEKPAKKKKITKE